MCDRVTDQHCSDDVPPLAPLAETRGSASMRAPTTVVDRYVTAQEKRNKAPFRTRVARSS